MRYDLNYPAADKFGQWTNFDPAVGRVVISGEPGYPRALVHANRNNVAPRVGFAWRPGPTGFVVRGGYGIFYASTFLGQLQTSNPRPSQPLNRQYGVCMEMADEATPKSHAAHPCRQETFT